jgi:uncharacterized protein YegJ (DUF2314 family)
MALPEDDPDFHAACARAGATLPRFVEHINSGIKGSSLAKLRFRDTDASDRLAEDRFLFLWLADVQYNDAERAFSGAFFEVPPPLQKRHHAGERLAFEAADIFDWMFLTEDGRLYGGYTLRVVRSKLSETQRADYDLYIGVSTYVPDT